jgi:uncharacterized protein with NRDE domain
MCLLVLAWQAHPRYRLVVAANRDEFHQRPTAPLVKWEEPETILAGRDLRANGTWLGLDRRRHFGVITNFRELQRPEPGAPSRGALIPRYLTGEESAATYLSRLEPDAARYSGFNLLLTDGDSLWYASNRAERFARPLPPGVYGLSNQFLDTPWPKLRRVRRRFDAWLSDPANASAPGLFALLNDRATATADEELPQTGITPEWERVLSAPFVLNPDYGTRCSTVLLLEPSGAGYLAERRFDSAGIQTGATQFALAAGQWP